MASKMINVMVLAPCKAGGRIHQPDPDGLAIEVTAAEAAALSASGSVQILEGAGEPVFSDAAIAEAIAKLDQAKDFTQSGKPEVVAIEAALGDGASISASDRDRVWATIKPAD